MRKATNSSQTAPHANKAGNGQGHDIEGRDIAGRLRKVIQSPLSA
jgi:hypothetical protein